MRLDHLSGIIRRRWFLLYVSLLSALLPISALGAAPAKDFAFFDGTDPAIYFLGRVHRESNPLWTWPGSGFRVVYNHTTSVRVRLRTGPLWNEVPASTPRLMWYRVDRGGWNRFYVGPNQDKDIALFVPGGRHQLDVIKAVEDPITFEGIMLDGGGTLEAPTVPGGKIEVVGDSLSTGYRINSTGGFANPADYDARGSYGWLLGDRLGAEVRLVAVTGRGLVHNNGMPPDSPNPTVPGFYPFIDPIGKIPNDWSWQPNIVILNVGTNDISAPAETAPADFQGAYVNFLGFIRQNNPGAIIMAMAPFGLGSGRTPVYPHEIEAAVALRKAAGDPNVMFIDTNGWLSRSDFTDETHPTTTGQIKIASHLFGIVRSFGTAAPAPKAAAASPTAVAAVAAAPQTCPGAPATRLAVGQNARVIVDGRGPSPIVDQPGGKIIFNAPEGTVLKIFDGPRCYKRGLFWLVYLPDGRAGWVLEGDRQRYFIEPA